MTAVLKDDTELFKQFTDNEGFRRWLQRFKATRERTLEINGAVALDLRLMILAVVAGLYLVFETPPAEQSGD